MQDLLNQAAAKMLIKARETWHDCWWECKLAEPLWNTVWRFLKKLKIELPYDPAIALLGIYPRDTGVLFRRDTCTPMFIAALSTIAKIWKEPKCPSMDEWIKKMWYIYIHWNVTWQSKRMRGAWVAQSVKHPTSAQVMISQSMSSSPASGSVLTAQSLEPVSDSVSPSL